MADKGKAKGKQALRLEWIEAGTLTDNPANWRRHSEAQLESLRELVSDPEIGWAGACLFNEKTGRLIDGHARKSISDPKTPVPVLVGSWSEEAEKKILATLDPVTAMAQGNADAYAKLVESVQADGLFVRDLIHLTRAELLAQPVEDETVETLGAQPSTLPAMELQPFEHYDYIVMLFRNEQDFQGACERLGIQRVQIKYPGGQTKIGLGRCVDGVKAMRHFKDQPTAAAQPPAPAGGS